MPKKFILLIVVIVAVLGAGLAFFLSNRANNANGNAPASGAAKNAASTSSPTPGPIEFTTPTKTPHYVSNTPAHGSILPAPPPRAVVDFDFDLSDRSTISIRKDSKEYGIGATTVDDNKLAMRRSLDPSALDGVYTVSYTACWPDNTCHDGAFQFSIDRTTAETYRDARNAGQAEIRMKDLAFQPASLRIRRDTTVTWVNDDGVIHYVNTDSHPSHTFEPEQNSQALAAGESYSYTFTAPGVYPFHCSAHADRMVGTVLVE